MATVVDAILHECEDGLPIVALEDRTLFGSEAVFQGKFKPGWWAWILIQQSGSKESCIWNFWFSGTRVSVGCDWGRWLLHGGGDESFATNT